MKAFILLGALLAPGLSRAAPFVVSDPYAASGVQPTYFEVKFDAGAWLRSETGKDAAALVILRDDLGARGLAHGAHTVVARACVDGWGCSAASPPFAFTAGAPGVPAIKIVLN
ncbi:hypothetical protein [uncultured Thiodictyon sp.]|uniref:hypothetical protein n=1 Tax=uncultured Thiodictyon sp. TaxID=1846217 RepID=UPI0025ECE88C|nr:hypothetical protein [uncultured Thiodictyon sp.]